VIDPVAGSSNFIGNYPHYEQIDAQLSGVAGQLKFYDKGANASATPGAPTRAGVGDGEGDFIEPVGYPNAGYAKEGER
jgi:hypothetical protein